MREPKFYTRSILLKLFPKYCKGKLIDVGAGREKYRGLLEKNIDEYVAIDDLSSDYQFPSVRYKKEIGHIADATKVPFGNNEFDSALCTEVIEHVEDPFLVVKEISRVLKPGGYLILASAWFSPFHEEPKDYWRFSVDGYRVLGKRAGLEFVEGHTQGGLFASIYSIVSRKFELRGSRFSKKLWMKTGVFRGGCLTGPKHSGTALHGFLSYLMKCAITGEPYTVFGYKGKQVRDNIHSYDLVNMFWHFYQNPRQGEAYNAGGGRHSNCSMLEAIKICEKITGKKMNYKYAEGNRRGDHIWWISDVSKFRTHFPSWSYKYNLNSIMTEVHSGITERVV